MGKSKITLVLLVLLAACGGSSDSPTAPADVSPFEVESKSTSLVNSTRSQEQISPLLTVDQVLAEVARRHSEAMRDQGFFSHVAPDGSDLRSRLREAGVSFRTAGENLAQVQNSVDPAAHAHGLLMESSSHRENILSEKYDLLGVGVAKQGNTYWITQIFLEP